MIKQPILDQQWLAVFLMIFLSIIWGGSFMLIKKSLVSFSPVELSMLRVSISGLAFLPLAFMYFRRIKRKDWGILIVVGLTGNALPAFLYALAQTKVDSSVAGILNGMTPIFTLLISVLVFKRPFFWKQMVGILLGFIGVSLLILTGNSHHPSTAHFIFPVFVILATICYGISGNVVENKLRGRAPLFIASMSVVSVMLPCLIILFSMGFIDTMRTEPSAWQSFAYVSFLAVINTVIASIFFYKLVQISGAVFSSAVTYLIPIVAVSLGFLDGELILWVHLISILMIVSGVYYARNVKN